MVAERDDPAGAEAGSGEHAAQPHRTVPDHDDGAAGLDAGGDRRVVTGRHDVGQRQDALQPRVTGQLGRQPDEGAVGLRHAYGLALAAVAGRATEEAAAHAGRGQPAPAGLAATAGPGERRQHQVADPHARHVGADRVDDAEELVADPAAGLLRQPAAVRPEVRAAHAGVRHADDGVAAGLHLRVRHLLHADVLGTVEDGGAHGGSFWLGERAPYDDRAGCRPHSPPPWDDGTCPMPSSYR